MTTPPTTLHDRLRAELNRRLAVARAATPGPWELGIVHGTVMVPERGTRLALGRTGADAAHIALHDPADAIRRYEGELQVLQQHTWSDRDKWRYGITCNGCPNSAATWPCPEIRSLAGRLGVSADG